MVGGNNCLGERTRIPSRTNMVGPGHFQYSYNGYQLDSVFESDAPVMAFGILNLTISPPSKQLNLASGVTCEIHMFRNTFDLDYNNNLLNMNLKATSRLQTNVLEIDKNSSLGDSYMCFESNNTKPPTNFTALDQRGELEWSDDFAFATSNNESQWCIQLEENTLETFWDLISNDISASIDAFWSAKSLNLYTGLDLAGILNRTSEVPSGFAADAFLAYGYDHIMDNLAASLTMLTNSAESNVNGTHIVTGHAGQTINLVHVRWPWLLLPYTLCLAAIVLLTTTIWVQRRTRAPLWKSSINAYFYHGIDFDMGIDTRLATVPEMDVQASATNVRLKPFGVHERLLLETTVVRRRQATDD